MRRTVMTAALLAAFAMPALAGDNTTKADDTATDVRLDQTTTSSTATTRQDNAAPTAASESMYGGCMHRKNTTANMM